LTERTNVTDTQTPHDSRPRLQSIARKKTGKFWTGLQ